ncbi:transposase [Streptomyces sp. NPDC054865]
MRSARTPAPGPGTRVGLAYLARSSSCGRRGRTVTEAARELGISSASLRGWVKKARAGEVVPSAPQVVRSRPLHRPARAAGSADAQRRQRGSHPCSPRPAARPRPLDHLDRQAGVPARMLSPAANGDDLGRALPVWVSPGSYGCGG